MNLANQLTMLRIVLASAMFWGLVQEGAGAHLAALLLFLAAVVTDWVDGYVARRMNTISAFGKVADPAADKILVLGALIALIRTRDLEIPLWGVFLIIARDLLVGALRTLAAVQGRVLAAERWGKWKMGTQSVSVALMLLILVVTERVPAAPAWLSRLPYHLTVLCVIVTWGSAALYFRQNRKLVESSWR